MTSAKWKRTKITLFVAAILMVVSLNASAQESPVTIVHHHNAAHGQEWMDWLKLEAKKYTEKHPNVTIEFQETGGGEYVDKMFLLSAAGELPDVMEVIPRDGVPFLQNNLWLNLHPLMERDSDFDVGQFIPVTLDLYAWQGGQYGLPASSFPIGLTVYNVDKFLEVGAERPEEMGKRWNWDALRAVSRKLTKDEDGDGQTDQYAVSFRHPMWRFTYWAENAGQSIFTPMFNSTESHFSSPAVIRAAEYMRSFHEVGWAEPTLRSDRTALGEGQIAMTFNQGATIIPVYENDWKRPFEMAFAPIPRGPAKGGIDASANGLQISSQTEHAKEVWNWVRFLTYDDEAVRDHVRITGRVPALLRFMPEFADLLGTETNATLWLSEMASPDSQMRPVIPEGTRIAGMFAQQFKRVLQGEIPVRATFEELDRQVDLILDEAHAKK